MQIIGISGRSGAGKDTLATALRQLAISSYKAHAVVVGLADPLREIAYHMGYGVYDRNLKEVDAPKELEVFEDRLYDAMDKVLAGMKEEVLAHIYASTIEQATAEARGGLLHWSPRTFCQRLGSAGTSFSPLVWVAWMLNKVQGSGADLVLVPDVRYPCEAKAVDGLVFVVAPESKLPPATAHASDAYYDALRQSAQIELYNDHTKPFTQFDLHMILIEHLTPKTRH